MSTAVLLVSASALLVLPGLLLGAALGLRGWVLVGSGPALTVGTAGVLAAWYGTFGIPWSLASAALGLGVLCGTGAALTRLRRGSAGTTAGPDTPASAPAPVYRTVHHVAVAGALVVTATLGAVVVWRGTGRMEAIPQYWDAMFHANAIRFIAGSGDAASSALSVIAQPANPDYYYPHTYHVLGALLLDASQVSLPVVLNALSACMPLVFALSLVAFLRVAAPRPTTVFAGAALAGTFTSFPYDLVNFGPLLPLALAIAVSAAACALLLRLLRAPTAGNAMALAVAAVGLLTTHPSAAVATALVMALLVVAGDPRDRIWRSPSRLAIVAVAAVAAVVAALPSLRGLLTVAGDATEVDWPAVASPGSAAGQLLLLNQDSVSPQWLLAGLVVVGAAAALHRAAMRPVLLAAGLFLGLFVLAAAYDTALSARLTAFWWNDRWRLAALYVVPAAVLAALGFTAVKDWVAGTSTRLAERTTGRALPYTGPAVVAVLAVALLALTSGGYQSENSARVAIPYTDGPTVSAGERAAYAELARLRDGGSILNDPSDGSPWAYALHGLPLVFKTPLTPPSDPEDFGEARNTLLANFSASGLADRDVQAAVEELDVRWVFVGAGFASPNVSRAPGLENLGTTPGVTLVWSNDVASIYRVDRDIP